MSALSLFMALELKPITLKDANAFVSKHHRHHGPVVGHKFSVSVLDTDKGEIVGVAIAGRPVARLLDDGATLEVTRVCTVGTPNVASMLYGALSRAAFALGHKRVLSYVLCTETGMSLKAAGWTCRGEAGGGTWNRRTRPRTDKAPTEVKVRYEKVAQLGG